MKNNFKNISVRHNFILLGLFIFLNTSTAFAGNAIVSWGANTEPDLAGYKVYHGTSPGIYGMPIDVGNQITYSFAGLGLGVHYFSVTAYDTSGNESGFSIEVSKAILAPNPVPAGAAPFNNLPPDATPLTEALPGETSLAATPSGETPFAEPGQASAGGGGGGGCGLIASDAGKPPRPGDSAEMIVMMGLILLLLLKKHLHPSEMLLRYTASA